MYQTCVLMIHFYPKLAGSSLSCDPLCLANASFADCSSAVGFVELALPLLKLRLQFGDLIDSRFETTLTREIIKMPTHTYTHTPLSALPRSMYPGNCVGSRLLLHPRLLVPLMLGDARCGVRLFRVAAVETSRQFETWQAKETKHEQKTVRVLSVGWP